MTAPPLTPSAASAQRAADTAAILRALLAASGNVRKAALAIGCSYATLQRRITGLGLRKAVTAAYPRSGRQPGRKKDRGKALTVAHECATVLPMKTTTNEMVLVESAAAAMGITVAAYLDESLETALAWWRMQEAGSEARRVAWEGVMVVVGRMPAPM